MTKNDADALVTYTNKIIAQGFGLDQDLNFVEDSDDMAVVEKIIEKKGLNEQYLQRLKGLDTTAHVSVPSLDLYKTGYKALRARAARKMVEDGIF